MKSRKLPFTAPLVVMFGFSLGCGGFVGMQGKAQAKKINEQVAKIKQATGDGADSAAATLETLAAGLENGTLSLQKTKDLLAMVETAVQDGELSSSESVSIAQAVAENSKPRKP